MSSVPEFAFDFCVGHYEVNPSYPMVNPCEGTSPFAYPQPKDESVLNAKIAIVDQEVALAQVIQTKLREAGFRNFELIADMATAIERIASACPDVVLLDVHTKPTNGWEILDTLRRDIRTQHIPVLTMTASNDEQTRITAFNLGALDFLTKPVIRSELIARVRNTLAAKIYRDMMTSYSLQLETDVLTDALTGIANRRAFDYELKRRMVDWNRQRIPLCLLMIDIDHFKLTNDRHGHQAGDLSLRQVARLLKESLREMDLVARFGGEEFSVILPYSMMKEARRVAERSRELVANHRFESNKRRFQLTVSIGMAEVMHGDDTEVIIRRADSALYKAKRQGRNRCFMHDGMRCDAITPSTADSATTATANQPQMDLEKPSDSRLEDQRLAIIEDEPHSDETTEHSCALEQEVENRIAEMIAGHREAIQCLARAAEIRDDPTGRHILRVGRYAAIIARELGFGAERVTCLEHAAQLHDVGKIGLPDAILLKPGALSNEEFLAMQDHCLFGSRIITNNNRASVAEQPPSIEKISVTGPKSTLMRMAALIAETHHERWDGTGYPRGLKGEHIPIEGRITAVADVFDALSTSRPYKAAIPIAQCFKILFENRGSHFDPNVVDAFFRCRSEIIRTFQEFSDSNGLGAVNSPEPNSAV